MASPAGWFELSEGGWKARASARPLASLIYEAVQNAFDQPVTQVAIEIGPDSITVEDDSPTGFSDPRLAYTVFLTDKRDTAEKRGRYGRGLKELLSVMRAAVLETTSFTLEFGPEGRRLASTARARGTRLSMARDTSAEEIVDTRAQLLALIPPEGVAVTINGEEVERPRLYARLTRAALPTVITEQDGDQVRWSETTVSLFVPRSFESRAMVFEMGLPVESFPTPWHVDIGQRIPLGEHRDRLELEYRRQLLALLFESLVPRTLQGDELRDDWLREAITHGAVSDAALRVYVQAVFGARAVLPSAALDDDRARQSGAHVLETSAMARGMLEALGRVLPTSIAFNRERRAQEERVRAAEPFEERALTFYRTLAKRILGRSVRIALVRKEKGVDGVLESAEFDRKRFEIRINVLGKIDLRAPLSPASLGVFFHELAHTQTLEHGAEFIAALEDVAGKGAAFLAREGKHLAEQCGVPWEEATPWRR